MSKLNLENPTVVELSITTDEVCDFVTHGGFWTPAVKCVVLPPYPTSEKALVEYIAAIIDDVETRPFDNMAGYEPDAEYVSKCIEMFAMAYRSKAGSGDLDYSYVDTARADMTVTMSVTIRAREYIRESLKIA